MEVLHQLTHLLGICPELIGLGLATTPQQILQYIYTYLKFKLYL